MARQRHYAPQLAVSCWKFRMLAEEGSCRRKAETQIRYCLYGNMSESDLGKTRFPFLAQHVSAGKGANKL